MFKKLINIASLLLLVVFLLPSIVKLEHHHENFVCKAKSEKHFHNFHEKCIVCDFEFSIFSSDTENFTFQEEKLFGEIDNYYISVNHSLFSKYSFLLRAPPYKQV